MLLPAQGCAGFGLGISFRFGAPEPVPKSGLDHLTSLSLHGFVNPMQQTSVALYTENNTPP